MIKFCSFLYTWFKASGLHPGDYEIIICSRTPAAAQYLDAVIRSEFQSMLNRPLGDDPFEKMDIQGIRIRLEKQK